MMSLPDLFIPTIPGVNSANLEYALSPFFNIIRSSLPPDHLEGVRIVLPGNGSFGAYTTFLRERGWYSYLSELKSNSHFYRVLAICSGFQSLCANSSESVGFTGMNLYPFEFQSLRNPPFELPSVINLGRLDTSVVPGTSFVHPVHDLWSNPSLSMPYFVHGYACFVPDLPVIVSDFDLLFVSSVNNVQFLAGVLDKSLLALQFHPELSGPEWRSTIVKFLLD